MASNKAIAAIALTLVICVPIAMGYVLSIESTDVESWKTSESVNLSDLILNSSSDYYAPYSGPLNNSTILAKYLGGATNMVAPNYASLSGTYSSIPQYASATDSQTYPSASYYAANLDYTSYKSYGYSAEADIKAGAADLFYISVDDTSQPIHWTWNLGGTNLYYNKDTMIFLRSSPTAWSVYDVTASRWYYNVESWYVLTDAAGTVGAYYSWVHDVSIPSSNYSYDVPTTASFKFTYSDGSEEWAAIYNANIACSQDLIYVNSVAKPGVVKVSWVAWGTNTIFYSYTAKTGLYADPASGWMMPADTVGTTWINGHVNESSTWYLNMAPSTFVTIQPIKDSTLGGSLDIIRDADGKTRITNGVVSDTLGNYGFLKVVIYGDHLSVSGIKAWPTMGYEPRSYNTINRDFSTALDSYSSVRVDGSGTIYYRVDSANIMAGTFPITYNAVINMGELYPSQSYDIKINSVAIYGDIVRIGDAQYNVQDGAIIVEGTKINLRNAVLSSKLDASTNTYANTINGITVGSTATPAIVYFWGTWSLTLNADLLESSTELSHEWNAGGFGLDRDGYLSAGLICAVATFAVLGMTGKMSGPKVAILALICGGAAIVYLIIA